MKKSGPYLKLVGVLLLASVCKKIQVLVKIMYLKYFSKCVKDNDTGNFHIPFFIIRVQEEWLLITESKHAHLKKENIKCKRG